MTTFSPYDSKVNSFYLAFYGRPADPNGLKFWSKQLTDNNGDFGAIVDFFAASEEAQVRFGTDTVAERIAEIYQQLFNRAPDTNGMAFWTGAIEQGHASLADVAISILNGAQGTDSSLAQLRQQAVDAFTAKVQADGSEYSGYASIEAARILVRAVTADASTEDMDALVTAVVSFADTATKNPKVVEAIAVNTTLLALFDTTRGVKEPVALAKALADTAKAAAGDPVTLEQLLRGGGMDKVLKVMPANATLKDVVKALAEGGLPAAVEVVYPTTPTTPTTPSYKLSFVSVTEGKDDDNGKADAKADNVTREKIVDVTFSYRGNDLNSSQKYEYSINGGAWVSGSEHIKVNTSTNSVVLTHIDLSLGDAAMGPQSIGIMGAGPVGDLLSNIELRAVRSDKSVIDSFKQQIVYDQGAERPVVSVTLSEAFEHFNGGNFTSMPKLVVEGIEPGARVEYAQVMNHHTRIPEQQQTDWSSKAPDLTDDGYYTILVRQIDAAGNISGPSEISFTLDREAPEAPTFALSVDSGNPGDRITNVKQFAIAGLEQSDSTGWEYRIDGGQWKFGDVNKGSDHAVLDLDDRADGTFTLQVRQIDAAGNVSDATSKQTFTFDTTAPKGEFSLDGVEGGSSNASVTSLAQADVHFSFSGTPETGDVFEYSLDGGKWVTLGDEAYDSAEGILTVSDVDFSTKDRHVSVRVVDAAGNATTSKSTLIDSTVNDVPLVSITKVAPSFLLAPDLALSTSAGSLAAVDKTKLSLDVMSSGAAVAAGNYFDGEGFKMSGNTLTLDDTPGLNLYQLGWEKGAFSTSKAEDVAAGSQLFVGGTVATVTLGGFAISKLEMIDGNVNHSNDANVNTAFIGKAGISAAVHGGGGNDFIADNGASLTLQFDKLSQSAYDVVIGFDSVASINQDTDLVHITGDIAKLFDDNRSGKLDWGHATGGKYTPQVGIEAVELSNVGPLSLNALEIGNTLRALNLAFDASNVKAGDDFLLLATYEDQSILLSYISKDANGKIDAGELAFLAIFDQGTVHQDDIDVIGTLAP